MSITEADAHQPGEADSPPASTLGTGGQSPRRRRWWLIALGALGVTCVVVAGVLAGTYQPVGFGGGSAPEFPGMPAAVGARTVNTFGASNGEIYVPPQRGVFAFAESIQNSGPLPVTIEAVTVAQPQQPGVTPWPLTPAGQARYFPINSQWTGRGRPVAGLSLRPGQAIYVGIPARMSYRCYFPNGWTGADVFYVEERFLFFTHWVAIPLATPLVFHEPEPGGANMVCPGR